MGFCSAFIQEFRNWESAWALEALYGLAYEIRVLAERVWKQAFIFLYFYGSVWFWFWFLLKILSLSLQFTPSSILTITMCVFRQYLLESWLNTRKNDSILDRKIGKQMRFLGWTIMKRAHCRCCNGWGCKLQILKVSKLRGCKVHFRRKLNQSIGGCRLTGNWLQMGNRRRSWRRLDHS